jgi:calmodulin
MVLNQEEIDGCREAFLAFDKDRSGTIDVWELRQVLEAMGQAPTEDELFQVSKCMTINTYKINLILSLMVRN